MQGGHRLEGAFVIEILWVLTSQHAGNFFGYASQEVGDTLSASTPALERA